MPPFAFAGPGRIIFGRGEFSKAQSLVSELGQRPFVVHGATPRHAGPFLDTLGGAATAHACPREPDLDMLLGALTAARAAGADCVVAIGGGAAIDLGKAVAGLLRTQCDPLDHLEVVGKGLPLTTPPAPFMAVPTTAGTGAEVTKNAVIGVPDHRRKVSLRDQRMLADIALVDPELTDDTPLDITLASGLDAITQVIEPYVSSRANPMTDALCRDAIPRGLRALNRLMQDEDPAARDDMALVSLFGGLALANAGLGAVHGLAGVIGGVAPRAPHGAVCGALLPYVMAANFAACGRDSLQARRLAEVRVSIGESLGTADLATWSAKHGLPRLGQMGVSPQDHATIAQQAQASSSMKANPVALSADILTQVLQAAG